METCCYVCKKVLTTEQGERVEGAIWDSALGMGALCSPCHYFAVLMKKTGDAMLTTALTLEIMIKTGVLLEEEYAAVAADIDICYQIALGFYMDAMDTSRRSVVEQLPPFQYTNL